jgi:hypothetical protein
MDVNGNLPLPAQIDGSEMATRPDRTPNGRFAHGWRGGPGRPRRATETQYLAALSDAVPIETWRRIVERAVVDAIDGDHHARTFLAHYLIGRPVQGVALSAASEDDGRLSEYDLFGVILGVLDQLPGGEEAKLQMAQAFRLMEEGCRDAQEAVRIAMSEPYPYASSPSATSQRERAEARESPRAEPLDVALVGSPVDAVHDF